MILPDRIWIYAQNSDDPIYGRWDDIPDSLDDEYVRKSLIDAELEVCCELVLAMGLSTGHGESHTELMKEVLNQVRNMRKRRP